jgi:hypothetical protein
MATRITFTVDDETAARLKRAAARTGKSKSAVIREVVRDYEGRTDSRSEDERQRILAVCTVWRPNRPPVRSGRWNTSWRRSGGRGDTVDGGMASNDPARHLRPSVR